MQKGHLEGSTSPWNTPLCYKRKSGKWRLLRDFRKVNATVEDTGALQPGLPSPHVIAKNFPIIIIDLQDCFFTIPLHPSDKKDLLSAFLQLTYKDFIRDINGRFYLRE